MWSMSSKLKTKRPKITKQLTNQSKLDLCHKSRMTNTVQSLVLRDTSMLYLLSPTACGIWYYGTMGHNKLDNFVANTTKAAGLTEHYTNQCLHATAITLLSRLGYGNKQIRSVSGYKSSTSLEIYQRVNDDEKIRMGSDLGQVILKCKSIAYWSKFQY